MNERIKALRKSLGLSQQEFSDKISLSRGYLANLEIGKQEVQDRTIKLICSEFNVNESWLRTGEGEMFVNDEGKDLFATLGEKYKTLDDLDKKIITEYIKLTPEERNILKSYIRKFTE